MFFTRTHKMRVPAAKEDVKNRLIGKHVKIHNLDFEVYEKDHQLSIIPHAEQINSIKTLPITNIRLIEDGKNTKMVITSKMRKIDSGGPQLIVIFCTFMLAASVVLLYVGKEKTISYTLLSIGLAIFAMFTVRMQMGYFDYVRKIRTYVKSKANPSASSMGAPFAQA